MPYLSIYRYCTTYDFILIVVGTIGAICGGAALVRVDSAQAVLGLALFACFSRGPGDVLADTIYSCDPHTPWTLPQPVFSILLGEMIETFGDSNDVSRTVDEINDLVIWFIVLAVVAAITSALEMYCWMQVGIRQSNIIREKYLRCDALLF